MKQRGPGGPESTTRNHATTGARTDASAEDLPEGPRLFMVGVPIGNLNDITLRALQVLSGCNRVVCEDTRSTQRLLSRHNIQARLESFRPTRRERDAERVVDCLKAGERVAFCSEAGTPALSDPGSFLVRQVRAVLPEVPIVPVPGPSSLSAALSVAGFQTNPTIYLGFPSPKSGKRRSLFARYADFPGCLVVFESVHRISASLNDLRACFPEREILIARELTKLYEQTFLWAPHMDLPADLPLRGEFTLVVGPER